MKDFINSSSKFYLNFDEFNFLDKRTKKKLKVLMSRIMERAYRRGVQQAIEMGKRNAIQPWIIDDTEKYRYGINLSQSPGLDGLKTTSFERLEIEENLDQIGL